MNMAAAAITTNISTSILFRELSAALLLFMLTHFFIRFLILNIFYPHDRKLPPGPTGWPIVGSLPFLGTMPHVSLANMAAKYGPILYLKLGSSAMVVASTPDAARAFLKTLDANFRNRPIDGGPIHLAYNAQDMVFARYGPKWQLLRKLCNLHMLGAKALDDWAHVRTVEVGYMLQAMYDQSSAMGATAEPMPVAVPEMLTYAMANMIGKVIFGKRAFAAARRKSSQVNHALSSMSNKSAAEFQHMVMELMRLAGLFNIGDFIPSIAWMDLQGIQRDMKIVHKEFDELLTRMMKEHAESAHERKDNPDFLDILMALAARQLQEINISGTGDVQQQQLTVINIKALILDLFTAGTDTSSSVIEWALAEMMNKPSILKRAQEEMDQVIGRSRRLEESDIPRLPYLQAICKETFRKHPSTPLNLPRDSSEACQVDGYYIPKNTRLMVNIWAIGRDPNVWENPLDFKPERFLMGESIGIEARGNHFELIPFGAGRRICAGTRMGMVMVEYILGTLVHSFDWKLAQGQVGIDMEESFGIALQKKVPLSAVVTPRLSPSAYLHY